VGRRFLPVALLLAAAVAVPSAHSAFGERTLGPQRILVALLTWGPEPFARDDVRRIVFDEVDAFYRRMSYGKVSLVGDVTPWLAAFPGPAGCNLPTVRAAGRDALRLAGYNPAAYDRVVYVHPTVGCPWSGVTQAADVFLNGAVTTHLVAHELGHSFGLAHANLTDCRRHGCGALEYGDPYDTMGTGDGDFSAQAKVGLGWLTRVTRVKKSGTYTLAAIERTSTLPQAFVATTANDQYWIEYRGEPARGDDGRVVADAGVIVRVNPSPDLSDSDSSSIPNLLLSNPAGALRPYMTQGERFVDTGVFTLRVVSLQGNRVRLQFKWTDATAPRAPRFTAALVGGRLQVTLDGVREAGSGVAGYEVTLDNRAPLSVGTDVNDAPVVVGRPLPGTHTVKLVVYDRAGNRSAPVVRRLRVR
jgi:hypothetical protein